MDCLPRVDRCCCISLKIIACIIGNTEVFLGIFSVADDFFDLRDKKLNDTVAIVRIGYLMDFVIVLLEVVSSVLLIIGVKGGWLWLVRFWIYVHAFLFTVILAVYLASTIVPISVRGYNFVHFRIFFLMYTVRTLIIYVLFILFVNSYYYKALDDLKEIDDDI